MSPSTPLRTAFRVLIRSAACLSLSIPKELLKRLVVWLEVERASDEIVAIMVEIKT